jgi:uncharacterized membrane protein YagU involved in acid resistance
MSLARRVIVGFAIGAGATVPMTGEFLLARRAGLLDEVPPHKAIRSVAPRIPEPRLSWGSAIAHLAVGGVAGAAYAAMVPRRYRGARSGILFGIGVWALGYEVVMPTATEMAPAHRDRRDRAASIFVAHLIYGAALGWILKSWDVKAQ